MSNNNNNSVKGSCAVCEKPSTLLCASCKRTFYCSRDHQKSHWSKHKRQCLPYKVLSSDDGKDRYVQAAREIKSGETIMEEQPSLLVPAIEKRPYCLGCGQIFAGELLTKPHKCSQCKWPLCCPQCEKSPLHRPECTVLAANNINNIIPTELNMNSLPASFYLIPLLRILILRDNPTQSWSKIMSHVTRSPELRNPIIKTHVVPWIIQDLKLCGSEEEVLSLCDILDCHTIEMTIGDTELRGLFVDVSNIENSCTPNSMIVVDNEVVPKIRIVATTAIAKGTNVTVCYSDILSATAQRRSHLLKNRRISCHCPRCADYEEQGTLLGAIKCFHCSGTMLPEDPLDLKTKWQCSGCGHALIGRQVDSANQGLVDELKWLKGLTRKKNIAESSVVDYFEEFLEKYKGCLRDTHSHVINAKLVLIKLYARKERKSLTTQMLDKWLKHCDDVLHTLTKFQSSGLSRLKGETLLDRQTALVEQVRRQMEVGNEEGAKTKMEDASKTLTEAVQLLRSENNMAEMLESRLIELQKILEGS